MRLIDADALEREGWSLCRNYQQDKNTMVYETKSIVEIPTAQPERKTGRWKRRLVDSGFNADWHCSECGWKTALEEHGYNYCPNCGADMRDPLTGHMNPPEDET